jgi:hypothetical protein
VCLAIFLKTEWVDLKEVSSSFWLQAKWWWCLPYPPTHLTTLFSTYLYPRMKQVLKWWRFANVVEIQRESLAAPDSISVEDFRQCFQQWKH